MLIRVKDLHAYSPKQWTLIPLRVKSKRPQDNAWTTRAYDTSTTIALCDKEQRNAGVRLTSEQLVIDVDPRNGGDVGFVNLCSDLGIDPKIFPHVRTGSGGDHYYMSKPGDVLVLDTLAAEAYRGVEFKSKGRQVVSAGSIHPDTGHYYEWVKPLQDPLPPVPEQLLVFIRRPQSSAITGGGGGEYTQEQITKALSKLDVNDFGGPNSGAVDGKWYTIMCACHHASNGEARSEFVEWSTSDPAYADQAYMIGRRWDSLHRERRHGSVITHRTLNKFLAEGGHAPPNAKNDFADDTAGGDDGWMDGCAAENWGRLNDDGLTTLEGLNQQYASVVENGRFRIVYQEEDPKNRRGFWIRMEARDFLLHKGNRHLERDMTGKDKRNPSTISLGKAWLEWPGRKDMKGVVFDPSREWPGYLNLWTGFAFDGLEDPTGEWSMLRELIFEVLANGDKDVDEYIINWLAYMIQFPERRAEVAIVFRGGRGVGKGTLGNVMCKLIGRHAMAVASPELLTGRFTEHLQDIVFLFADEAIRPYDKAAESRFKAMITEPKLAFEGKFQKPVVDDNYLHIMLASNESWVIPAGLDERRFMAQDANTKWREKGEKHWNALHQQLGANDDSGYKRLLFDLKRHRLPKQWSPRAVPMTKALIDQKVRNLSPAHGFFFNALCSGDLRIPCRRGPWSTEAVRFFVEDFDAAFEMFCSRNKINAGANGRSSTRLLLAQIEDLFPNARTTLREAVTPDDMVHASPSDNRAPAIELPSLSECRANFERQLGSTYEWERNENDFG